MTRKEAIKILSELPDRILTMLLPFNINYDYKGALAMAISALAEELSEDGTLTVHVSDGSKVKRVLVMGDNIFGGLYYPDSAENKGDTVSRAAYEQIMWERDTAIQQLKDLGYGLGEKPKENKGERDKK